MALNPKSTALNVLSGRQEPLPANVFSKQFSEFATWLSERLPNLRVKLRTKAWKGASAVEKDLTGIEAVVANYQWPAVWRNGTVEHASLDWVTTRTSLEALRAVLRAACLESQLSDDAALSACESVTQWGGDRNSQKGAMPFLRGLHGKGELASYLRRCKASLALETANDESITHVLAMNSMLTKIHALLSDDGLPIYDSRVAGAVATLVEMFRRESGISGPTPEDLCFPSVGGGGPKRKVTHLFRDASWHGVIWYRASNKDAQRWADAQVRLGRILALLLHTNSKMFADQGELPARSRALEAGLFMIGYDLDCLKTSHQ